MHDRYNESLVKGDDFGKTKPTLPQEGGKEARVVTHTCTSSTWALEASLGYGVSLRPGWAV